MLPLFCTSRLIKFRYWSLVLTLVSSCALVELCAQPILLLKGDTLQKTVSTQGLWVFRSMDTCLDADVARFTDVNFDDRDWNTLISPKQVGEVSPEWNGYGWFRLHINADTTLLPMMLSLTLTHREAMEVYCDGVRVAGQGKVGVSLRDEIEGSALGLPVPIYLRSGVQHVITVRFSNHTFLHLSKRYGAHLMKPGSPMFDMEIRTAENDIARAVRSRTVRTIVTMIPLGILLFVAFLYAVFYIFIRRERSNLYLALFSVFSAGLCFSLLYRLQSAVGREMLIWNEIAIVCEIAALALSLMGMLYWVVYGETLRRWWYGWSPGVVVVIVLRFIMPIEQWNYVLFTLIAFAFADMVALMLTAFRKRIDDVLIIAVGNAIFLASAALYVFIHMQALQHILWLFALSTYTCFLSIPVTMAFYIARRFARVNDRLWEQLENVQRLSHQALEQEKEKQALIERQKAELEGLVAERTKELQATNELLADQTQAIQFSNMELLRKNIEIATEREKSEELLLNILPAPIAERLKAGEQTIADKLHDVTVLFADIAGFTRFASTISPENLVSLLDKVFSEFDRLVEKHGAEKIKTIGDAYMAIGGLSHHAENHTEFMAYLAMEMHAAVMELSQELGIIGLSVRIGLHSGEAVAGIIGTKKLNYDLWGDTVNMASRMESLGEAGKIHCTEHVFLRLRHKFIFTARGEIRVKGKGLMHTYFLENVR
ncbi:MAG: adenylate/guanylate cyclase domain-containing protein [Candidatus Kapaibacteriota bacterium]